MSDNSSKAETPAIANVALILLTHVLAFLLRHKRISREELEEIFGGVVKSYTSPIMPSPTEPWQMQIEAIVRLTHDDVLQWAQVG